MTKHLIERVNPQ
jgi:hypothetical protein